MTEPHQLFPRPYPPCPVDSSHRISGRGLATGATEFRCEDCDRPIYIGGLISSNLGGLGSIFGSSGLGSIGNFESIPDRPGWVRDLLHPPKAADE